MDRCTLCALWPLAIAIVIATPPPPSAKFLGARFVLSDSGLDQAASTAVPLLTSYAENLTIPEIDCHASQSVGPTTVVLEVSAIALSSSSAAVRVMPAGHRQGFPISRAPKPLWPLRTSSSLPAWVTRSTCKQVHMSACGYQNAAYATKGYMFGIRHFLLYIRLWHVMFSFAAGDVTIKYAAKWCYLLSAADELNTSSNGCTTDLKVALLRVRLTLG